MRKYRTGFLFLIVACFATSCYDCGPQAEPLITLSVRAENHTLQRVTALGAISDSVFNRFPFERNNGFGELPLSLLQDSTTYLFYFEDRVDTLTLFYKRIFDVRRECGYYVDIAPPTGRQYQYRSTFSATEVIYSPYVGEMKGLYPTAFGISVSLTRY
jgi:hypothetical protein